MYDFARRPLWILSHVLVVLAVAAMVFLGFWQRSRWQEEQAKADAIEERANSQAVPIGSVLPAGVEELPSSQIFRRVVVVGQYDTSAEVLIRNRSEGGAPGAWVVTPLVPVSGPSVAVVRGWIPLPVAEKGPGSAMTSPPDGEVAVTGVLRRTQRRGSVGSIDPAAGQLDYLSRVDLERIDQQYSKDLVPAFVLLDAQQPKQPGNLPQPASLELPNPSQNISYMVQWWIFATIALIGYPLILRKVARSRSRDGRSQNASGTDTSGTDTGGADPSGADPSGADLSRADAGSTDADNSDRLGVDTPASPSPDSSK